MKATEHTSHYIAVGSEQLHYLRSGSGHELLLAFHGYSNNATLLDPVCRQLGRHYTTLSFDLPHHGNSRWQRHAVFTKENLVQLIEALKVQYNVEKVSLLGYSMGGRVCLSVIECCPQNVYKTTLVASDGLKRDPSYHFFTRTAVGKILFRHMLNNAGFYMKMADLGKAMGIVAKSRHTFLKHSLPDKAARDFLLRVWPTMADLSPQPDELKKIINKYQLPVSIFMGNHDKIIPAERAAEFKAGLDTVTLHVLAHKGHRIFDDDNIVLIAQSLL